MLLDGRPIGLLQRSVIADYPEELTEFATLVDVPEGAVELDYLIGDPGRRGRGLGARMVAAAVADTWPAYPAASRRRWSRWWRPTSPRGGRWRRPA